MHYTIVEIADRLGGKVINTPNEPICLTHLAEPDQGRHDSVVTVFNSSFKDSLSKLDAGCVVLAAQYANLVQIPAIIVDQPRMAQKLLLDLFNPEEETFEAGIHPSAVVSEGAKIHPTASIGPQCVIASGVQVSADCIIEALSSLGQGVVLGARTRIQSNVVIGAKAKIGEDCLIYSGVVIGSDGFGFEKSKETKQWTKLKHIGSVLIGDRVEIGANTTVDRGTIGDTVIARGVKIDNHCHFGHNVTVGANTVIAGFTSVSGSVKIGADVVMGGHIIISDHITITDHTLIKGDSTITQSITESGTYGSTGLNAMPDFKWKRCQIGIKQLPGIIKRLARLEHLLTDKKEESVL